MQPPPPPLPQAAFGDTVLPEKAMHPTNIRRAALALEAHAHTMPAQRRDHLTVSQGSSCDQLRPHNEPLCNIVALTAFHAWNKAWGVPFLMQYTLPLARTLHAAMLC